MPIEKLDHVNVRTTQLDEMIQWYTHVLGLHSGPRPNFSFPGAWMYAGDSAVVHLVGIEGAPATGAEVTLKLEHFALAATGMADFEARLTSLGEDYKRNLLSDVNLVQINLWDPDGNHIHVDFRADE